MSESDQINLAATITRLSEAVSRMGIAAADAHAGFRKAVDAGLFRMVPGDIIDVDGRWHVVSAVSADGKALSFRPAGLWLRFRLWSGDTLLALREWWAR